MRVEVGRERGRFYGPLRVEKMHVQNVVVVAFVFPIQNATVRKGSLTDLLNFVVY